MGTWEESISKFKAWKFLVSTFGLDVLKKSGKNPCTVCCSVVSNNSIKCSQCKMGVHKRCSGITEWLLADLNYVCPRCNWNSIKAWPIDGRPVTHMDVDGTMLDVEAHFCYLGDMLCPVEDSDSAIATWHCVTWGKFRKLLHILATRHLSLNAIPLLQLCCNRGIVGPCLIKKNYGLDLIFCLVKVANSDQR